MNIMIKSGFVAFKIVAIAIGALMSPGAFAAHNTSLQKVWRFALQRKDGKEVIFLLKKSTIQGKTVLAALNGAEEIKMTDVVFAGDSLFFSMPAFEASFRLKQLRGGDLSGVFVKGTAGAVQHWQVFAKANNMVRFKPTEGGPKTNLSGKWMVNITRPNGTTRNALATFQQKGNHLTGSFLTPSADYRYLEGIVTGDSMFLSSFDGDNARLFEAIIDSRKHSLKGVFYNGYDGKEVFTATKDSSVALPTINDPTSLRDGYTRLDFTFNNLDDQPVSINDEKYKNKVVIVQIMGSWCANCLDETRFLADYYKKNRAKGVEIIALGYEYTTDRERSKKSIERFKKLFDVQYPILITGVTASDDKKGEKTLPQLTAIKSFPTTIFIDKKGNVREIHTSFYGPGSGEYYNLSTERLINTVNRLLAE